MLRLTDEEIRTAVKGLKLHAPVWDAALGEWTQGELNQMCVAIAEAQIAKLASMTDDQVQVRQRFPGDQDWEPVDREVLKHTSPAQCWARSKVF